MPQTLLGPKNYEEEISDEQSPVTQISFQVINFDPFGKDQYDNFLVYSKPDFQLNQY